MQTKPSTALRATAALSAAVLLLGGCGTDSEGELAEDSASSSEVSADTSPEPTQDASGDAETLPVYWVTDTEKAGPRLIREFVAVTTDDALVAAAELVVSGSPADDDYRTLWPSGEIDAVTDDGSTITVALADDGWQQRPTGMTKQAARQALQQMVYTLQGVAQARTPVVFTVDGEPATVLGIDTSGGIRQTSPLRTLNHISITAPDNDEAISGDGVEISGAANSFEANVVCQLVQNDETIASAPFTAEGWMGDKLFPFAGELPLAEAEAGPAQIRCSTDDASGGVEGFGAFTDDKDVTIG